MNESPFCTPANELELARRLHRSLLPRRQTSPRADVACHCQEHAGLGGDYATAYWQAETRLFLSVCDVTGHGLASALLAARINTFVRLEVRDATSPCMIIEDLNRFLATHFHDLDMFATFFCAVVDWDERYILYAGAGHPPALLIHARGGIEELPSTAPLLGVFDPFPFPCGVGKTRLEAGDLLLLYTDGLIEAAGPDQSFYDMDRLRQTALGLQGVRDATKVLHHLTADVRNHRGTDFFEDDLLLLAACLR